MRKIFSIFIVMLMLLLALFGCANEEVGEGEESNEISPVYNKILISDEKKAEILNLYQSWALEEYGEDFPHKDKNYFTYYGKHSGFYVVAFNDVDEPYYDEYIGGLDFAHPGEGTFYAVSDKVCGTLNNVYEAGHLTKTNLQEIYDIHTTLFFDTYYSVGKPEIGLEEYKQIVKDEIKAHADSKGQDNFSAEDWAEICEIVDASERYIDGATSKVMAYGVKMTAKAMINAVENPLDKWGVSISEGERTEILEGYGNYYEQTYGKEFQHDENSMFYYYGKHNGYYIFMFPAGWGFDVVGEYIGGLDFSRNCINNIYALKNDEINTLREIYKREYLNREELEKIHGIHIGIFEEMFNPTYLQNY